MRAHTFKLSAISACAGALLMACGGGGGGSSGSLPAPTGSVAITKLTGTAASGAAFSGATITVTDKTGATVGSSSSVGADGTFSISLSANAQAPFVLTATRTNGEGATETMVSVVPTGTGTTASATVNISPVTHLIAARLSASGDPTKLATELAAGTSTVNATTVGAKTTEVQNILAPVITATGATTTDPLTGTFTADGTGYDRLLDSIKVTITPAAASSSNIEVAVKQQSSDSSAPTTVNFSNTTTTPPTLPSVTASNLLPSGTSALIAQHLAQLTTCFALPAKNRVSTVINNGTAAGTAANVVAPECKAVFVGGDPSTFKHNGQVVGSANVSPNNANSAFAALFRDFNTNTSFSQGTYEFTRGNGDIVVGFKSQDAAGGENYDTFVLRLDTDGKLKQIGNQYAYPGGVVPYQQLREFVTQSSSNYLSTGYDLRVPLINGVSYVEVTAPSGNVLTLIPGSDSMVLPKRGSSNPLVASGTTFVRLRSEYVSSAGAPTSAPAAIESGPFFVPTDLSDTDISNIPNQGVWAFKYYSGGSNNATGGTPLATQYYKTRTRANSIAELRQQQWAALSAATLADMQSRYTTNAGTTTSFATLPATTALAVSWTVPTGALPPTNAKLFGSALYYDYANNTTKSGSSGFTSTTNAVAYVSGRTAFNDGQAVSTKDHATNLLCSNGARDVNDMGEKHCASPAPGYLSSARQTGLHLWARDGSGREYAHFYATYSLQ